MNRILIIEDERPAAEKLERLILVARPTWQVIGAIETVEHAVKWLKANPAPNLIMMDIQLSDGISFEIFEHVKVSSPVIFTTAYDEFAIRAFKVNSIDYLLKPIDAAALATALEKFEQLQVPNNQQAHSFETLVKLQEPIFRKRFLVKVGPAYHTVLTGDVELFYISERSTFIRTFDGKNYALDFSLDQVQQQLDPAKFFRINRNYLVNIDAISKLVSYSSNRFKLVLASGYKPDDLLVSRDKTSEFKRWMDG